MSVIRRIQTHQEKVQFLLDYLNEKLEEFPLDQPLMIYGRGANGKSHVVREVSELSPIPICVFGGSTTGYSFFPTQHPSSKLAVLIVCIGEPEDFDVAEYMGAKIVEFVSDPAYASPS